VVDGIQGVQGNGPGGTDAVDLRLVAAGVDIFAVDAVMAAAMGFDPLSLGLLQYGQELGLGAADVDAVDMLGASLAAATQRSKPPNKTPQQMQCRQTRRSRHTYKPKQEAGERILGLLTL
jgi:uncharacterized protein (DUF362 family)